MLSSSSRFALVNVFKKVSSAPKMMLRPVPYLKIKMLIRSTATLKLSQQGTGVIQ